MEERANRNLGGGVDRSVGYCSCFVEFEEPLPLPRFRHIVNHSENIAFEFSLD